jgi:cellulose synthase/poly-beta-1,6-N-acetylglucosamine synthase-like glycosyltransferase
VSLTVLTEGLFAMLGGLAAALIVFVVAHAVTVVSLACRPQAGPAFAALTVVCRAGRPSVQRAGLYAPRVSVHLPCHAEPGQIVIGTLDCLARLNYPDFEVLVIDNNTADPEFWLPVKANPAPGCPHNKYARTPQRAGNPVPRRPSPRHLSSGAAIGPKSQRNSSWPVLPSADRTRPACRP